MAKDGTRRRTVALALGALTALGPIALVAPPAAAAERTNEGCPTSRDGQVRTDPDTGATIQCSSGTDGRRWHVVPRGTRTAELGPPTAPQVITPPSTPPATATAGRRATYDPLPADLGDPTGLPPGVVLPPGTTTRPGSPFSFPALDWWKSKRWMTAADVATTDLDAVHQHFVAQCEAIGWLADSERTVHLPTSPPPGRYYDDSVQMVIGACRTRAGSATDPTRRRPWYLDWSVALRPGATSVQLVVELRDTSPWGGRFG